MNLRSPCVGVCDARFQTPCSGCGRFMTEVSAWENMPDRFRMQILRRSKKEGLLSKAAQERYPKEVLG